MGLLQFASTLQASINASKPDEEKAAFNNRAALGAMQGGSAMQGGPSPGDSHPLLGYGLVTKDISRRSREASALCTASSLHTGASRFVFGDQGPPTKSIHARTPRFVFGSTNQPLCRKEDAVAASGRAGGGAQAAAPGVRQDGKRKASPDASDGRKQRITAPEQQHGYGGAAGAEQWAEEQKKRDKEKKRKRMAKKEKRKAKKAAKMAELINGESMPYEQAKNMVEDVYGDSSDSSSSSS